MIQINVFLIRNVVYFPLLLGCFVCSALRVLLCYIKHEIQTKYPTLSRAIVGNFLFLRFICHALLSPEEYDLVSSKTLPISWLNFILSLSLSFCVFVFLKCWRESLLSVFIVCVCVCSDPPQMNIRRGLVLLSKLIQILVNGTELRATEQYAHHFNSFILEHRNHVAELLDQLSVPFLNKR
jgi:hypothetical protein